MALQNAFGNLALDATLVSTNTKLDNILTELNAKLEAGQQVALDSATLAALETISLANTDYPDAAVLAKLEAIRVILAGTLTVSGTVSTGLSQPLTDTQLRNSAVLVSAASLPLPTGAATEATLLSVIKDEDSVHASGEKGIPIFGIRSDSDAATAGDGDYTLLKLDEEGRLKVSSKPASFATVTGDITAVQATIGTPVAGGTVIGDVSRASNVVMFCTGTFSTVNVSFEASIESSGENWFGIQAVRSNANTIETATGNLSAAPAYSWEMSVNAYSRVRVRCTARTSGTQSWRFNPGTYATEPIPATQISGTQPVSGSVTVSGTATNTPATPTVTNAIINSAASTNGTILKGSAGTVYSIAASNINAAVRYLKIYNSTTVTVGTTVPALTIPIPAGGVVSITTGAMGQRFGTGICIAMTTGAADSDTGAVAVNEIKAMVSYI